MKEKKKNEIATKYDNEYITIDNSIVRAREKTNLLESKIEFLAVHHLTKKPMSKEKIDAKGKPYNVECVVLSAKEIQELMQRNDGDSYTDIRHAAFALKQKMIITEDKQNRQFLLRSVYGDVAYSNGQLYIEFNNDARNLYIDMMGTFTKYELSIMFAFKTNGGFQLYKLLKSHAFAIPPIDMSMEQDELPTYRIEYSLNSLRMKMGYVDIMQDKLKEEANRRNPDFEKMVKEERHPRYKRWSDFNTRVITPGINEINEISDIYIAKIEKNTMGRGGKVTSIDFYIQHNKAYYEGRSGRKEKKTELKQENTKVLTEDEKNDVQDWLEDALISRNIALRAKQLRIICDAANYDKLKITQSLKAMDDYNYDIKNVVGFLVTAIKEDWVIISAKTQKTTDTWSSVNQDGNMSPEDKDRYFFLLEKLLIGAPVTDEERAEYRKLEQMKI